MLLDEKVDLLDLLLSVVQGYLINVVLVFINLHIRVDPDFILLLVSDFHDFLPLQSVILQSLQVLLVNLDEVENLRIQFDISFLYQDEVPESLLEVVLLDLVELLEET